MLGLLVVEFIKKIKGVVTVMLYQTVDGDQSVASQSWTQVVSKSGNLHADGYAGIVNVVN